MRRERVPPVRRRTVEHRHPCSRMNTDQLFDNYDMHSLRLPINRDRATVDSANIRHSPEVDCVLRYSYHYLAQHCRLLQGHTLCILAQAILGCLCWLMRKERPPPDGRRTAVAECQDTDHRRSHPSNKCCYMAFCASYNANERPEFQPTYDKRTKCTCYSPYGSFSKPRHRQHVHFVLCLLDAVNFSTKDSSQFT